MSYNFQKDLENMSTLRRSIIYVYYGFHFIGSCLMLLGLLMPDKLNVLVYQSMPAFLVNCISAGGICFFEERGMKLIRIVIAMRIVLIVLATPFPKSLILASIEVAILLSVLIEGQKPFGYYD